MIKYSFNFYFQFFIQLSLNFIFWFYIKVDKRIYKILKLKKNFEKYNFEIKNKINYSDKTISVFEMFNINENIITFFVWSIFIKKKYGDNCVCYPVRINHIYNPITSFIYKKLGFSLLNYNLNIQQKIKVKKEIKKINYKYLDKKKLLNLKIKSIPIGDLIYDHYLRYEQKPTLEINSKNLNKLIKNAIEIFIFWDDYFKKNKVSRICFSHSPYLLGLPGRIASFNNIDSLCLAGNSTYRFNEKNIFLGDQFKNFNQILNKFYKRINLKNKKKIISNTKKDLKNIFSGKNLKYYGVLPNSQKNTFKKIDNFKFYKKSNNFKILIAAHDFFEGPNLWGKFVFPDFYDWLKYLVNYVDKDKKSNREWFLKPHPDASKEQLEIIKKLLKKNNKIKILPSNTTHRELINNKINFVLSARGSIGHQYAYFGINTLYCSDIGLYKNFDFIFKSKNVQDYKKKLDKMELISKRKIAFEGILKFLILLNVFVYKNKNEFILPNIDKIIKNKKLFLFQARSEKYKIETLDYVKKHLSEKKIYNIFHLIEKFLKDKNNLVMDTFQI